MSSGLLPKHIGPLVDRLRSGEHDAVSLPDVAALTEVLMRSLESYFKSIDLTIYKECEELAEYIDDARKEISSLSPEHNDTVGIPRAGLELDAIVQQTEEATNTIMESAERIMEADSSDLKAYTTTVNDAVMQIFEACSFQDITGQRISKVVSTLSHVEDRVSKLVNILGVGEDSGAGDKKTAPEEAEIDEDAALLNGPALDGEGMAQSDIDALLNEKVEATDEVEFKEPAEKLPETASDPAPAVEVSEDASADDIDNIFSESPPENDSIPVAETIEAPESESHLITQAKAQKAAAQAKKKAQAAPPEPAKFEEDGQAAIDAKPSENTSQDDIDALFA